MSVVDFSDLQLLSGYKQVGKVIGWLKENKVSFVVGGDGRPRTTSDILQRDLNDDGKKESATEVCFD